MAMWICCCWVVNPAKKKVCWSCGRHKSEACQSPDSQRGESK